MDFLSLACSNHVNDLECASVLDDYVVHIHGSEIGERYREGYEVDGGAAVELEKIGVFVVPLPSKG